MSKEDQAKIDKAVEIIMPEAIELKRLAEEDKTTKDGYGRILTTFVHLKQRTGDNLMINLMALALERLGYPKDTLGSVLRMMR